jgi:hypothetical protein
MLAEEENELFKLEQNSRELTNLYTTLFHFVNEIKYGTNWHQDSIENPGQFLQRKRILDAQYKISGRPIMDLNKLK